MRFYTKEECETWLLDRHRQKPDLKPDVRVEPIEYPSAPYLAAAGWSEVIREAGAGGHFGITAEGLENLPSDYIGFNKYWANE